MSFTQAWASPLLFLVAGAETMYADMGLRHCVSMLMAVTTALAALAVPQWGPTRFWSML
jgi:hypothetical protein